MSDIELVKRPIPERLRLLAARLQEHGDDEVVRVGVMVSLQIIADELDTGIRNAKSGKETDWQHYGTDCGAMHPGRTHEQWQHQVHALMRGFGEGRDKP
jgi:hypothetical protein